MYDYVKSGDEFDPSAQDWNGAMRAARTVAIQSAGPRPPKGGIPPDSGEVVVFNAASAPLPRYTVAAITGPINPPPTSAEMASAGFVSLDPAVSVSSIPDSQAGPLARLNEFLNSQLLRVELPTSATQPYQIVLLGEPLAVSGVGIAYTDGVHPCRIHLTSVSQTHVKPVSAVPRGGYNGLPLVWVSGTVGNAAVSGSQWGMVRLPAETDAVHPCRVSQVSGIAGAAASDCTFTYSLYDRALQVKLNAGGPVSAKTPRFPKVAYTAATHGEYWREDDGSYVLNVFNEIPAPSPCSS